MRISSILLAALLLTGCAARHAAEVKSMAVGRSRTDLEECMGIPSHTENIDSSTSIEEWDYNETSMSATLPLASLALLPITLPLALSGSVALSGAGNCKAIATVSSGHVQQLVYSGADNGLSGKDAVCASVVRGCFREWLAKRKN